MLVFNFGFIPISCDVHIYYFKNNIEIAYSFGFRMNHQNILNVFCNKIKKHGFVEETEQFQFRLKGLSSCVCVCLKTLDIDDP